jgi:hypothetical protein
VPLSVAARPDGRCEVTLLHHLTDAAEQRVVDWVVVATQPAALTGPVVPAGVPVHRVGDCLAPGDVAAAVAAADRAVLGL